MSEPGSTSALVAPNTPLRPVFSSATYFIHDTSTKTNSSCWASREFVASRIFLEPKSRTVWAQKKREAWASRLLKSKSCLLSLVGFGFAHLGLHVVLDSNFADQVELRL